MIRLLTKQLSLQWTSEWQAARNANATFIAPLLFRYEATNAVHRAHGLKALSAEEADILLNALLAMPIEVVSDLSIHRRAMEIARALSLPAAYDAHFLVVAQDAGAEFWTTDERLFNAVRHRLAWVRLAE